MRVILSLFFILISVSLFSQTENPSDTLIIGDKIYEKKEDLELSLSQGKIILGDDGNFHIDVKNPGKAILYINSRKRNKEIGAVYFIVKKRA